MKLTKFACLVGLVVLGATEALRNLSNLNVDPREYRNRALDARGDSDDSNDSDDSDDGLGDDPRPANDELWHASKCRGLKLMLATSQDPQQAARFMNPLTVPWDSDLRNELATWGYIEGTRDPDSECEIGSLKLMLDALKISIEKSQHGGPNYCFSIAHRDGDVVERDPKGNLPPTKSQYYTVDGRKYRVTEAHAAIVINAEAGFIFFLSRGAAAHEARRLWGLRAQDPLPPDELPALRASSDIVWGFWNRVSGDKLSNINGIVSMLITNGDTRRIMDRVLVDKELYEVPVWPGIQVNAYSGHYLALLGSPNGRAVGYFLAQHKAKIGGNRCVSNIRIFRSYEDSTLPHILFNIAWAPPPNPVPDLPIESLLPPPGNNGLQVAKRSEDETNIIRRHVLRADL